MKFRNEPNRVSTVSYENNFTIPMLLYSKSYPRAVSTVSIDNTAPSDNDIHFIPYDLVQISDEVTFK